jgi:hypothetical protein
LPVGAGMVLGLRVSAIDALRIRWEGGTGRF